jgi:L-ascorbate peroxidase
VSAVEMLQPIKDQVPNVSWADLMQMASALAVEDAGGPKIDMRYGREDCPTEDLKAADGVLPGEVQQYSIDCSFVLAAVQL